jgi:hypothetical protein
MTMRERPILMSGPMVRAILAGAKSQTRRVVKPQPKIVHGYIGEWLVTEQLFRDGRAGLRCPFGQPGNSRLWVRETWLKTTGGTIWYRADGHDIAKGHWRPSIFMPRWACRLVLELTAVRVERVQDISEADAKAEGVPLSNGSATGQRYYEAWGPDRKCVSHVTARLPFTALWDSINAKRGYSWASNPWVWVLTFRRLEA